MFTGSGFPMRFADTDGSLIDVYQAPTQITDELSTDWSYVGRHIAALLDGALGPEGYYGVFTTNMHTDIPNHEGANAIVSEALRRGVPVVSAAQMLDWLDARNGSSFQGVAFDGSQLRFTVATGAGARGLEAMVPAASAGGALLGLSRDGVPVATAPRTVKGVDYAMFVATPGTYTATYAAGGGAGRGGRRPARRAGPWCPVRTGRDTAARVDHPATRPCPAGRHHRAAGRVPGRRAPLSRRPAAARSRQAVGTVAVHGGRGQDRQGRASAPARDARAARPRALARAPSGDRGEGRRRESPYHADPDSRPGAEAALKTTSTRRKGTRARHTVHHDGIGGRRRAGDRTGGRVGGPIADRRRDVRGRHDGRGDVGRRAGSPAAPPVRQRELRREQPPARRRGRPVERRRRRIGRGRNAHRGRCSRQHDRALRCASHAGVPRDVRRCARPARRVRRGLQRGTVGDVQHRWAAEGSGCARARGPMRRSTRRSRA